MNTEPRGVVVLAYGGLAPETMTKIAKLVGNTALFFPDEARMAGAHFCIGEDDTVAALRKRLEAGSLAAVTSANPGLSANAAEWLANGERGVSSETIFTHLTGVDALNRFPADHPCDPDDFRRCRLLLEQVPELKKNLGRMGTLSSAWAGLVLSWDRICTTMDWEAPGWRDPKQRSSAPATYQLIQQAIGR